jgi:hypothetical protein
MARTRALMTETDRDQIAREGDVSDSQHYQAISRVRDRLDELERDIEVLEEHHPQLLAEVREVVCEDAGEE